MSRLGTAAARCIDAVENAPHGAAAPDTEGQIAALRRENLELRRQAGYYQAMHGKAVERERRLKDEIKQLKAKVKHLEQQLRERQVRRSGSEKQARDAGFTPQTAAQPRRRGQQPGSKGHGRRDHSQLPAQVEVHELEPSETCCPECGGQYRAAGSEDSETLEIDVRAYRRVIKRKRYRRSCQCAGSARLISAAPPPRLIPKGILGISVWVMVLIDKYLLFRPTYRLLADLTTHGLHLSQGTLTDGLH